MTATPELDAFLAADNRDAAIAWGETAIAANPSLQGDAELCRKLGRTYVLRAQHPSTASPARDCSLAIDAFRHIVQMTPADRQDLAAVYILRGDLNSQAGIIDLALTDYTAALALDPDCAETYSKRACIYQTQGENKRFRQDTLAAQRLAG